MFLLNGEIKILMNNSIKYMVYVQKRVKSEKCM